LPAPGVPITPGGKVRDCRKPAPVPVRIGIGLALSLTMIVQLGLKMQLIAGAPTSTILSDAAGAGMDAKASSAAAIPNRMPGLMPMVTSPAERLGPRASA
jgi:hypothetical protein